ncbi:ABC transporter substrate-binding protein [Leucobacter sp. HY1908]
MKKNNRLIAALALLPAAALVLAGCSGGASDGGDAGGDGLTKLKVATIGLTSDGSLINGIEKGFFEEEGLEIETSIVANPPAGLAAAQGGQIDVAYSPSIPLMNALSQGVALYVVGAADGAQPGVLDEEDLTQFDDTGLFAGKDSGITSIKDLAGKKIAIPARKAQLEVVIADLLEQEGINPDTGVEWVVLDFTSAVAALKSGNVDAAALVSPFTSEAEEQGSQQIAAPSVAFFGEGAVGLWVSGKPVIEQKPDAIAAFQRAVKKSNEYANEHPEESIEAGLKYTDSKLSVDEVVVPYWPLEVAPRDLENVNDKMVKLGFLEKPVDLNGIIWTKG